MCPHYCLWQPGAHAAQQLQVDNIRLALFQAQRCELRQRRDCRLEARVWVAAERQRQVGQGGRGSRQELGGGQAVYLMHNHGAIYHLMVLPWDAAQLQACEVCAAGEAAHDCAVAGDGHAHLPERRHVGRAWAG